MTTVDLHLRLPEAESAGGAGTSFPPASDLQNLRVAFVHEWLVKCGGSERVLQQMLRVFPRADLFAVVDFLPSDERGFVLGKTARTTFVQRLPLARTRYRSYLPLMPVAVEQFDLSAYDLVISSSHAVAKGVLTGPDQLHVCMCYSPMRYAWDLQHEYLSESGRERGLGGLLARWLLHRMRLWDYRTANGVDEFIAISGFIARRIAKTYGRSSTVIYPPVDTEGFDLQENKQDYYITASRMVPYKRMAMVVDAFAAMPGRRLVVVGDGPEYKRIASRRHPNIELLGHLPPDALRQRMQQARAFVFAAREDFGIMPLEAQACGTPVIAFGAGGAAETIIGLEADCPTGILFHQQTATAICEAVETFEREERRITPAACRQNALRFSAPRFREEFSAFVARKWNGFRELQVSGHWDIEKRRAEARGAL